MTKSFAIPGLRVGYAVASEEVVGLLRRIQPPWSMNALAAWVGTRLSYESTYLDESRQAIYAFRQQLREGLQAFSGIQPMPSEANFILCRLVDSTPTAQTLAQALAQRGILIRVCDDFTGLEPGRFIRIAVRRPEENERLLQSLGEILHNGR